MQATFPRADSHSPSVGFRRRRLARPAGDQRKGTDDRSRGSARRNPLRCPLPAGNDKEAHPSRKGSFFQERALLTTCNPRDALTLAERRPGQLLAPTKARVKADRSTPAFLERGCVVPLALGTQTVTPQENDLALSQVARPTGPFPRRIDEDEQTRWISERR
jgi:hypothetical protein